MADTIIEKWYLVDLQADEKNIGQVLWGIVVDDRKGRWVSGNFVCTSPVVQRLDNRLFRTKNSEYLCQGEGEEVTLPAESLIELRSGYSPDEFLARKNLRESGFQVL